MRCLLQEPRSGVAKLRRTHPSSPRHRPASSNDSRGWSSCPLPIMKEFLSLPSPSLETPLAAAWATIHDKRQTHAPRRDDGHLSPRSVLRRARGEPTPSRSHRRRGAPLLWFPLRRTRRLRRRSLHRQNRYQEHTTPGPSCIQLDRLILPACPCSGPLRQRRLRERPRTGLFRWHPPGDYPRASGNRELAASARETRTSGGWR